MSGRSLPAEATVVVHELYRSVQGETTWAGTPCTLVRLSGCNLRCRWCDTPQAFTGGTRRGVAEVAEAALSLQTPLLLVTGGEPLLQPGTLPLLATLCDAGRTVMLETSGERDIGPVDPRVIRVVDLKAPGSGESNTNRWDNIEQLREHDEVKFVLADRRDYEWARERIAEYDLASRVRAVLLSPVFGELPPRDLTAWMLEDRLPVRMQLQLHKYIWGAEAEGV